MIIPNNKIGAILVYKNKIISVGYNHKISSKIQKKYNIYRSTKNRYYDINKQNNYIHAEINCLQNSTKLMKVRYNKCSLFVYRQNKGGEIRLSKPCGACSHYIKDLGIKNIYYTTDNGWNYERRDY